MYWDGQRRQEMFATEGFSKTVIKAPESSFEEPSDGDEVEVHYTGTLLDGTKFASSRDTGKSIKFYLGQENVIEGLNLAISTMTKGENSIFTIPPSFAFGESGYPPIIPSNATLRFDVELLNWAIVVDICGDAGIVKKLIRKVHHRPDRSQRFPSRCDDEAVFVKYCASLEDGTVVSKSEGVEFTIKEGFFCPAFAEALKTMIEGERVVLTVQPQYGFGREGRTAADDEGAVPPNAILYIDLDFLTWRRVTRILPDCRVAKKILTQGHGKRNRLAGTTVEARLIGKLENGTVFMKRGHDGNEPLTFKIGEGQVVNGLERAIKEMYVGEIALVTVPPEDAFGSIESKQDLAVVPPLSTVTFEVELVSIVAKYMTDVCEFGHDVSPLAAQPSLTLTIASILNGFVDGLMGPRGSAPAGRRHRPTHLSNSSNIFIPGLMVNNITTKKADVRDAAANTTGTGELRFSIMENREEIFQGTEESSSDPSTLVGQHGSTNVGARI